MDTWYCWIFNSCSDDDHAAHYSYVVEEPDIHTAQPIPEPSSVILGIAGALIVGYSIRRKL